MKAWQIYLISVFVLSFPVIWVLDGLGHNMGRALGYNIEGAIITTGIIGGIITGIYYVTKWSMKERKEKEKV